MYTLNDDKTTPHKKKAQPKPAKKADHEHEYIRFYMMARLQRFDGSVTEKKYKFTLPDECIDCGHASRCRRKDSVELEVSIREFRQMKTARQKLGM